MRSKVAAQQPNSQRTSMPTRLPTSSISAATLLSRSPTYYLQKAIGNSATTRLLKSGNIQPKLTVSHPEDESEREADRVADQVMRTPDPEGSAARRSHQITPEVRHRNEDEDYGDDSPRCFDEKKGLAQLHRYPSLTPKESVAPHQDDLEQTTHLSPSVATSATTLGGAGTPLPHDTRSFFEPRFGADFSQVRVHTDSRAAEATRSINARAFTLGRDIVFGSGQYAPKSSEGQALLAHELTHTLQQRAPQFMWPLVIQRQKGKLVKAIVGWVVKVGERKLIKTVTVYSENELTKLLSKGYNVLVTRGSSQAKRIAEKVWGENVIHHTGHIIRKTGKKGLSHFQPGKHLVGKAGEKGWHIFYGAIPILFFSEDVEAMEVYEDKYPGKSFANYLTVTKYVGEDSWLSNLDWINPLELLAIGGDIGRDWDRDRTKELKALVFNRVTADGTTQTYELDAEGALVRVILVRSAGKQKILSADEYYTFLGQKSEEGLSPSVEQDGTKHEQYASTFDADYRIYNSKGEWVWDNKTLSFYLPAEDAKRLQKIDEFYVLESLASKSVYAYVHPRHRAVLKRPGFGVPEDMIDVYASLPKAVSGTIAAPTKDSYLEKLLYSNLQAAKMRDADLWKAK